MKKKLIRSDVFETNSSSSHSVSIGNETKEFVLDTIYPDQNGNITLTGGEFGWDWFKHNDAITKANYAAVASNYNSGLKDILIEVLTEQTGADNIIFAFSDESDDENWSYIDHDSVNVCPINKYELKNFIFNKNSWLFGGNDNSEADPTFYLIPEFKGGIVILPDFKYKLIIDGYNKSTKFVDMPTHEEIRNALYSLLQGVYLHEDGYFDDDNSFSAQINRDSRKCYEFTTWHNPIDFENNICYFVKDIFREKQTVEPKPVKFYVTEL